MNILLAEDDSNISTIALMALEHVGNHKVTLACDGEAALNLAINNSFDLILLDEMMPKMNGLSVASAYKKSIAKPSPIIFLSAKSQHGDIEEFKKWGLGFIPKPFDPLTLCRSIEEILTAEAA